MSPKGLHVGLKFPSTMIFPGLTHLHYVPTRGDMVATHCPPKEYLENQKKTAVLIHAIISLIYLGPVTGTTQVLKSINE